MVWRVMTDIDRANRGLVERFFAASERGDRDEVSALVHDDMVMDWPQSGERFRGRDERRAGKQQGDDRNARSHA